MSDPRETLARIRAQADAATEGPWELEFYWDDTTGDEVEAIMAGGAKAVIAPPWNSQGDVGIEVTTADAEFIAAARTVVPALVDALEDVLKLHRDGGESQGYLDNGHYGVIDHCCTECGSHGEYGTPWPCPTVKAITTALEGETHA